MQVRWSPQAADNLADIVHYIQRDSADAAQRVAVRTFESAGSLGAQPFKGRLGRLAGTRELPLPGLPYIVVYRVMAEAVEIANIIHGAQRWP